MSKPVTLELLKQIGLAFCSRDVDRIMSFFTEDAIFYMASGPEAVGRTVAGKQSVGLKDARAIGRYAVRLDFDDGHDTGLYSWAMLHELGRDQNAKWADYLARMKREGLSR